MIAFLLASWIASAERVEARLVPPSVAVGDASMLEIEVAGEDAVDAEIGALPRIDGLDARMLEGPEFFVKRDAAGAPLGQAARFRVELRPRREGRFALEGFTLRLRSDEDVAVPRIELVATGDATATSARLELSLDRDRVYSGEALPLSIAVDLRNELVDIDHCVLELPGSARVVPISSGSAFRLDVGSGSVALDSTGHIAPKGTRLYEGVIEVVAGAPGELVLGDAVLRIDRGTDGGELLVHPRSAPRVEVRPLPKEGRPPEFVDAVGRFDIGASVGVASVQVASDFSVIVRVTSGGASNLSRARLADWQSIEGFRVHERRDGEPALSDFRGRMQGTPSSRSIELKLAAKSVGKQAIPPLRLAFFDPIAAHYEVVATSPLAIDVTAPEGAPPAAPDGGGSKSRGAPFFIVLLILLAAARRRRRRRQAKDAARGASAAFDAALRDGDPADPLRVAKALAAYLGLRFGVEPASLFGGRARIELLNGGIAPKLLEEIGQLFDRAEAAAFAKQRAADSEEPAARRIVAELESTPRG